LEYNQQLQQFAFIAAHNLRAPAARILGLGKILEYATDTTEEKAIIEKLITSTAELDTVIKDLNVILEIKRCVSNHFAPVNLSNELKLIRSNLENEIHSTHTRIEESFEGSPILISVKSYINSILVNLVGNAIKYRSPSRTPVVKIKSFLIDEHICISISDNGLGFDTERHHQNIFSLYKRFHFHVEGKGMGLYMVKTQVLALGGKIEVESVVNKGTTFRVYLKSRDFESPLI